MAEPLNCWPDQPVGPSLTSTKIRHVFGRYLHRFQSLAEARRLIGEFIARYNTEWLIERLGHRTPADARLAMAA